MTIMTALATLADDGDHMMWGHDGGGWMWLWATIMMLAVVAAVGVVVWLVVRSTRQPEPRSGDRAREILAERYARGELSTEEYHERLDALR
jgi:putative membrane protein